MDLHSWCGEPHVVFDYLRAGTSFSNPYLEPSGMDMIFAEVAGRSYYVVTDRGYEAYTPKYGGDVIKILANIGPDIIDDASYWIGYYWDQLWK